MPRLQQIPRADAEAPIVLSMYKRLFGDRDPVAEPGTATGTPGDWWTVFANSPDVLEHACRGLRASTPAPTARSRRRAARARPDPRRLAGRQPVRVLAALQVVPRARLLGGEDRGAQGLEHLRPVLATRAHAARVHRRARAGLRSGRRRGVRRAARAPERRGDPRVHLHHDDVHDARGHLAWRCASSTTTATIPSSRSPRPTTTAGEPRPPDRVQRRQKQRELTTKPAAAPVEPDRSPASACSSSATSSPGRSPDSCSATTAPTSSRSSRRTRATRCGTGASPGTATASGGRPSRATSDRSCSTCVRTPARTTAAQLAEQCDVVLENFRPGTLERWGLGYADLAPRNPRLVMVHVSGFGQTGPLARASRLRQRRRGDGRHPLHDRQSRSSAVARRHQSRRRARVGVRRHRHTRRAASTHARPGEGQEVDVAIYEAVAALMESTMADYELGGVVRTRSGSVLKGVAPSNVYPTSDGAEVVIAANADTRLRSAVRRDGTVRAGRRPALRDAQRARREHGRDRRHHRRMDRDRDRVTNCSRRSTSTASRPVASSPRPTCSPIRSTWPARWSAASCRRRDGRSR